jgi:hypothetical protein
MGARNAFTIDIRKPEGKFHLEYKGVDRMIIAY